MKKKDNTHYRNWAVTGTVHGSIIVAASEGDARRAFHWKYNGESILCVKLTGGVYA